MANDGQQQAVGEWNGGIGAKSRRNQAEFQQNSSKLKANSSQLKQNSNRTPTEPQQKFQCSPLLRQRSELWNGHRFNLHF